MENFGKKTFKEDFNEGKGKLLDLYRKNGYIDARITSDSVWVYKYEDKEGLKVQINIEEGPQYIVRDVTWDGNSVYNDDQLTTMGFEKGMSSTNQNMMKMLILTEPQQI